MQTYSQSSAPPPGPKNYVFVDEHNRHKRLKVMRACEGCRRRKIKCDSATTNTWPCAACVRLRLPCVPPAAGLEGDTGEITPGSGVDDQSDGQSFLPSSAANIQPAQSFTASAPSFQLNQGDTLSYDAYADNYLTRPYANFYPSPQQYQGTLNDTYQPPPQTYAPSQHDSGLHRTERAGSSPIDLYSAEDLMEHLGELKIGENGIAPYLRSENSNNREPDAPIQEPEPKIAAAFSTDAGSQIRIPPALMPPQDEALQAFETFFRDIHPYVPVLNKNQFYHQWHNDKESISPLVLEAVFANAGRLSDDPAQGAQWLALANSKFKFGKFLTFSLSMLMTRRTRSVLPGQPPT